jgi:hypothetical protein
MVPRYREEEGKFTKTRNFALVTELSRGASADHQGHKTINALVRADWLMAFEFEPAQRTQTNPSERVMSSEGTGPNKVDFYFQNSAGTEDWNFRPKLSLWSMTEEPGYGRNASGQKRTPPPGLASPHGV